jgi:serine/threonine protein kinase
MSEKSFGRYRVLEELGRGAMGTVYRAVDPLIEREVAIKTLLPNLPDEEMAAVRERFLREAKSAGRMNHPSVVTVFDVGEQDGVAWMAMEILSGRSLQQVLRQDERLPFDRSAELAAQVADALDYAREFGIVHRDVKPANIMVNAAWRAKLVDFGIAYVPSSTMTQTGLALGSPRYMSPEQVLGLPIDPRADIFSLGIVLYEMLTLQTPFERPGDNTIFAMMNRIASEPHQPVSKVDPSVPAGFDRIIDRALAKKAGQRYARAGEMADDLRNWASRAGMPAEPPRDTPADGKGSAELIADLDTFALKFSEQEQAALRAEQEAYERKRVELEQWSAARMGRRAEDASPARPSSGALDMLRKQAATQPPKENPARRKAERDSALDSGLRGAFQYLAEYVKELNDVTPASGKPYEFIYLGKIPALTVSDAQADIRLRKIEGKDVCDHIIFRYRITPAAPVKATLIGADIARLQEYLERLRVPFQLTGEAKDDFGKLKRATFTVAGPLPCEATIRGDYDSGMVLAELTNVRRPGRMHARFDAATLRDVADDFARYVIGADDDFAKLFTR